MGETLIMDSVLAKKVYTALWNARDEWMKQAHESGNPEAWHEFIAMGKVSIVAMALSVALCSTTKPLQTDIVHDVFRLFQAYVAGKIDIPEELITDALTGRTETDVDFWIQKVEPLANELGMTREMMIELQDHYKNNAEDVYAHLVTVRASMSGREYVV